MTSITISEEGNEEKKLQIFNHSIDDIKRGNYEELDRCALIQISEPYRNAPTPRNDYFTTKFSFAFPDNEYGYTSETELTQIRALKATLAMLAKNEMNIIVHCSAGLSRSGAVVEAAIDLGYEDPQTDREPNKKLLELLI